MKIPDLQCGFQNRSQSQKSIVLCVVKNLIFQVTTLVNHTSEDVRNVLPLLPVVIPVLGVCFLEQNLNLSANLELTDNNFLPCARISFIYLS